jgi:hypothetical protein
MAKASKQQDHGKSVLWVAYEALQRGDAVEARRLAKEVLAGKRGPNDEKVAKELAAELSAEGAVVPETIEGVANDLLARSGVPSKPYLMVATVVAAYAILLVIAITRY